MRYGQNPLKEQEKRVEPPAAITVGVLNHIPAQTGYFRGQLDSLKLCLASIRHHADQPIDLLVVDNGSCAEVQAYLQGELAAGRIDYLILNRRNMGKANAVFQILRAAPGDLVFYSDGDIYYKPGWVQAHLDVLRAFPRAGLIGGIPLRIQADYYTAGTLRWVAENQTRLTVERGDLIPEEWTRAFLKSVGVPERDFAGYFAKWRPLQDCRVTAGGVTAYVGASHAQFLTSRQVIERLPHRRFGLALNTTEDQVLDRAIEDAGWLRLSTERPFVYHIGNVISEDWLREEFKRLVQDSPAQWHGPAPARRRHWFWGHSRVRLVFRRIHEWAFDMYYQNA